MTLGILVNVFNTLEYSYIKQAIIQLALIKKNVGVPVTWVTDHETYLSVNLNQKLQTFIDNNIDTIKIIPKVSSQNRIINGKNVEWKNKDRNFHRFYEQTILLDSDYLPFGNELILCNNISIPYSFNNSNYVKDISGSNVKDADLRLHEHGPFLSWATVSYFKQHDDVDTFLDLVEFIKENYEYYGALYRFRTGVYRNDFAFTIAAHILNGFKNHNINLPFNLYMAWPEYSIKEVKPSGLILNNALTTIECGVSVHLMNKKTIDENFEIMFEEYTSG